jgi:regulator of cell morphogenesis and NO signaling
MKRICADWSDAPLASVITYLEGEHHAVTRGGLFRIGVLFTEACRTDSDGLAAMRAEFRHLAEVLVQHMEREELTLFPAIVSLEEAWTRGEAPAARFEGGLRSITDKLVLEHRDIARRLAALRDLREAIGEEQRAPFARLFAEIEQIERHIHEYMNLENYVVFPRAIALEDALKEKTLEAV